eukprot:1195255-Prorocentrum_minimum.AAC.2
MGTQLKPAEIARRGLAEAKKKNIDFVIVDTSGRLQVDAKLMGELKDTKKVCKPNETLLVVDAMTGQEAANLVSESTSRVCEFTANSALSLPSR